MTLPLILASQSPRRAALLKQAGFRFEIVTRPVDESAVRIAEPEEHVKILAKMKAEAVLPQVSAGLVIGADTIVYADHHILGKPRDRQQAVLMLKRLSGRVHEVYTGFTLLSSEGASLSACEMTRVEFRELSDWEIHSYVNSGGPMDKAGAYGIQEAGGLFVRRIEGCFYNVVGFPLSRFFECLQSICDEETVADLLKGGR